MDAPLYRTAIIDPVAMKLPDNSVITGEEERQLRETLVQSLTKRMTEAGYTFPVDDEKDAIHIRATITDVTEAIPALNVVTTLLIIVPVTRGGVAVEIEAYTPTGARLAALAFTGKAGIGDAFKAFTSLGHTKKELDRASLRFADLLSGKTHH